jgi:hypothetical protein
MHSQKIFKFIVLFIFLVAFRVYGHEGQTTSYIDEIVNKTINLDNDTNSNNKSLTYKQFYKVHEEKAKLDARKRLNLSAYKTSKYTTVVNADEFGHTSINPKEMLECWWETLSTEMITRFFLKQNFDENKANCQSKYKETALHYCNVPHDGDSTCVAAALRMKGIEIDVIDEHGTTPLFWAVHNDYLISAALLIDAGANMEITDKNGKTLFEHAQTEKMRNLLKDPVSMATTIIQDNNEQLMGKVNELTKMQPPSAETNSKAGILNRADILGGGYNKNVVKLSMFNWDEEIHVKLQVERKPCVILFTRHDCEKCQDGEHVINVMAKSFTKELKFYIMDAVMDEPPRPFGKQDELPSLYFREINSKAKKSNVNAIKFDTSKHGNLQNEIDVLNFIKSHL